VASGVAAGDCHGSGAQCGGSDRGGSGGGAQSTNEMVAAGGRCLRPLAA
jgi:hypothetical protein